MKIASQKIIDGERYQLEFYDGFDCGYLDESHWLPYYLPQWSSRELSSPRFEFSENGFSLNIEQDQQPWCPEFNGKSEYLADRCLLWPGGVTTWPASLFARLPGASGTGG